MTTPEEIVAFWFDDPALEKGDHPQKWWTKDPDFDEEIRARFGDDIERAKQGEYDDWAAEPDGMLALVLLLDQFTRNVYRDTPEAFSGDEKALALSRAAIERGLDLQLDVPQRAFLYMPLEHAEYAGAQEQSIAAFERLAADARLIEDDRWTAMADLFLDFAHQHKEIIDRFGRYPHRNEILGRETTDEEAEFLQEPGSSF
jgi:uncharacterized protein (DUF924 family)